MASKLYVGGLPFSTTPESVRQLFTQCGSVEGVTIVTDRYSGQSRGFGFVTMATETEAREAIAKFDGQTFEGRRLKVELANAPDVRSGGSREGSFSGGRRPARW